MSYTQLTEGQRYQIYSLKGIGLTQAEIARQVSVDPSTISRELKRNTGQRGYRPKQANDMAIKRRLEASKAIRMTEEMQARVTEYLNQEWSPEQISSYLRSEGGDWVSHETIYQFVLDEKKMAGHAISNYATQVRNERSVTADLIVAVRLQTVCPSISALKV